MHPGARAAAVAVLLAALVTLVLAADRLFPGLTSRQPARELDRAAREILEELVAINTVEPRGSTEAALAMAARFRAAGFPDEDIHLVGPLPHKQNLVVRLRGTRPELKPLLLLAHLDVVEARREDWSTDPFTLAEKDGYLYGRGTTDMKDMAACWVVTLLDMKRRGIRPQRDVVLALTADEEGGSANGVEWLVKTRRDLIEAAFCLTEGGGGQIHDGRYTVYTLQAAEKVYLTFRLEATDPGGHSALPRRGNPIVRLAAALGRLDSLQFPARLNEVTRSFFARMADVEGGSIGLDMRRLAEAPLPGAGGSSPPSTLLLRSTLPADAADAERRLSRQPYFNALLRTTCTATRIEGGHAENALPQRAIAWVNCRLLPDDSPDEVERALVEAIRDANVKVTRVGDPSQGPAAPLVPEVVQAVEDAVAEMWPHVIVVPTMLTGATDGRILRRAGIPPSGLGAFEDISDSRAHGRDERIGIRQFREERALLAAIVTRLSGAPSR